MKRVFAFFILLMLLTGILFAVGVSGIAENCELLPSFGEKILENSCDFTLSDFSETPEMWESIENEYVTVKETVPTFPYTPLTGDGCLAVKCNGRGGGVKKVFPSLDLSEYKALCIPINSTGGLDSVTTAEITLKSGYRKHTAVISLPSEEWSIVKVDISSFKYLKQINEIDISAEKENEENFEFFIDGVFCISDVEAFRHKTEFLFSDFTAENGSFEYSDNSIVLKSAGEYCSLFTLSNPKSILTGANGLKITYISESEKNSLQLYSANKNGEFELLSASAPEKDGEYYSAVFDISDVSEYGLKIAFPSFENEEIRITKLSPATSFFNSDSMGKIESCAVNNAENTVVVRGSLSDSAYLKYKDGKLVLLSLDIGEDEKALDLSKLPFDDEISISEKAFVLRSELKELSEPVDCLYKKYICGVIKDNSFVSLGVPFFVSNPEIFGTADYNHSFSQNKKGFYNIEKWQINEYAIGESAVWFDVGKFFSRTADTGSKFTLSDDVFYYNSEYAEEIDREIKMLTENGVNITLVIRLSDTGSDALNEILCHPNTNSFSGYCAFNTEAIAGVKYLRAVCRFLADRYCSPDTANGRIQNVSVGYNVNSAFSEYNMGKCGGVEFAQSYAKAFRIVNNTFKSVCSSVKVFVSVDGHFNEGLSYDVSSRYDGKAFLKLFSEIIRNTGNIGWNVIFDPAVFGSEDGEKIVGFKNSEVLTDYLKTINYSDFSVGVVESDSSETDEKLICSRYIFGYYKTVSSDIDFYIAGLNFNNGDVLKYIDTDKTQSTTYFAPELLKINDWESAIPGFYYSKAVFRNILFKTVSTPTKEFKGEWTVVDFGKNENGFQSYGGNEILKSDFSLSGVDNTLYVKCDGISDGKVGGVIKMFPETVDLSVLPYIYISVNPASLPENTSFLPVRICFSSGKNRLFFTGNVRSAEWNEICCDLSGIEWADKIDSIAIVAVSENGTDYGSPQICISSIVGKSTEYDRDFLEVFYGQKVDLKNVFLGANAVKYYACVAVLATAAIIYRKVKRKNKR